MDGLIAQLVALGFGIVISALQAVIVMYQKANNKKLDEVCHRVYHHQHDECGRVVITD